MTSLIRLREGPKTNLGKFNCNFWWRWRIADSHNSNLDAPSLHLSICHWNKSERLIGKQWKIMENQLYTEALNYTRYKPDGRIRTQIYNWWPTNLLVKTETFESKRYLNMYEVRTWSLWKWAATYPMAIRESTPGRCSLCMLHKRINAATTWT